MIRILIADDHAILRQGLMQILSDEFTDAILGEASTISETATLLKNQVWDVLILDINMPDRSGIDLLHALQNDFQKIPVLVLSSTPEDQLAMRTLKAGASGYLNKQVAAEELVNAVRKLLSGGRYISQSLAEKLAADITDGRDRALHELLSEREFQVFNMMISGKSLKDIADELSLSIKTISTFRSRIFKKLKIHTDMELYQYAHSQGLINSVPANSTFTTQI